MPQKATILREADEVEAIRALAKSRRAYAFARYLARHQKKPSEIEKAKASIKGQEGVRSPRKRMSA